MATVHDSVSLTYDPVAVYSLTLSRPTGSPPIHHRHLPEYLTHFPSTPRWVNEHPTWRRVICLPQQGFEQEIDLTGGLSVRNAIYCVTTREGKQEKWAGLIKACGRGLELTSQPGTT